MRFSCAGLLLLVAVAAVKYGSTRGSQLDQWSSRMLNPVLAELLYARARLTDPDQRREPVLISRPNLDLKVVAHGTTVKWAPANTLENFRVALQKQVDFIEIDVQVSRDGVPLLFHNVTVDVSTNGSGTVASLTLAELKALRLSRAPAAEYAVGLYADARIPTLRESLQLLHGKACVLLELKATPNRAVVELFNEFNFAPGCLYVFSGFSSSSNEMLMLQYLWPDAPLAVRLTDVTDIPALLKRFPYLQGIIKMRGINPLLVDGAHAAGLLVVTFVEGKVYDSPSGYARVVEAGYDLVMADNYDSLVNWLQQQRSQASGDQGGR
jgi:glycerophosphoryl diester phosphodiesterase